MILYCTSLWVVCGVFFWGGGGGGRGVYFISLLCKFGSSYLGKATRTMQFVRTWVTLPGYSSPKNSTIYGKSGLSYLGKATAAPRTMLPFLSSVCRIFVCPDNGMSASVWDFCLDC